MELPSAPVMDPPPPYSATNTMPPALPPRPLLLVPLAGPSHGYGEGRGHYNRKGQTNVPTSVKPLGGKPGDKDQPGKSNKKDNSFEMKSRRWWHKVTGLIRKVVSAATQDNKFVAAYYLYAVFPPPLGVLKKAPKGTSSARGKTMPKAVAIRFYYTVALLFTYRINLSAVIRWGGLKQPDMITIHLLSTLQH